MKTASSPIDEVVELLVSHFPVEDIWLLEAGKARECGLAHPVNLVVISSDEDNVHVIEEKAIKLVKEKFPDTRPAIHVFPLSVLNRMPRPLLIKMAFTAGRKVHVG